MDNVIKRIASRLGLTTRETIEMISHTLDDELYQEGLVELLGYDMMDDIEMICMNQKYFIHQEDESVYVERFLPEWIGVDVDRSELINTDVIGDDKVYFDYDVFNIVQSKVLDAAYRSDENMLVCAPTGAGKTDIALMCVLRALNRGCKVVYIVPMRALATEISTKYRRRLKSYRVVEYTGDTEMKTEDIIRADVVISTPEKFDVVTRKQCNAFRDVIGLVVIDEIHLLQDDRGAVIEAIVGRMFRYIELRQKPIRIVGISATLPNHEDIAVFLKARHVFYFDQSYRPVPLKMSVVGMKKISRRSDEEELLRTRAMEYVNNGKQVLVFVHSRGNTINTGKLLIDESKRKNIGSEVLSGMLLNLAERGIGIHHAGLPRRIRLYMEERFKNGDLDILVSTSTLAWGVNLPAYAVIIRGTRIYDGSKGRHSDMSILDVLQIFGRAGRPQYDDRGEACLITTGDKLDHYVSLLMNSRDIESRLLQHVADVVNAEIYLDSIVDMNTAMIWLKNTFMYVRMVKNPMNYGLRREDLHDEERVLSDYMILTCDRLERSGMIRINKLIPHDIMTWRFCSTEYGRISSMYYLSHETMELWLKNIDLVHDEDSILRLSLGCNEFMMMKCREEDEENIHQLCGEMRMEYRPEIECKLMVLTKAHIKRCPVVKFSLVCDSEYIVKNLRRIVAGLSQLLISVGKHELVRICCILLKKIERQKKKPWDDKNIQVSLSRTKEMVKIEVIVEGNDGYWMFIHSDNSIIYSVTFNHKTHSFLRTNANVLRIEIIRRDEWMMIENEYPVNDEVEEDIPIDLDLKIRFIQVDSRLFRERQQCMNSSILSMIGSRDEPVVVITPDVIDMRNTAQDLNTRMSLIFLSDGRRCDVRYGNPPDTITGVFVTTFDRACCISGDPLIIFKGCSDSNGYASTSKILRICDHREVFIYENRDYIEYFNSCVSYRHS